MATVNYIREKTQSRTAMKRVIDYVLQDKKTLIADNNRKYKLISGKDCSPETVFNEFMATKNQYGKAKGMFFYQYTQSFGINVNISPQTVHEVGCKLAEYFKDHEVLITTHIDADHLHNHFIINSVSHKTGKKLQEGPDSLYKLRKLSDSICLEYGLTVLTPYEKKQEKGIGTREYRAALKGDSWKFKLINAIDICMNKSKDKKEFIGNMEKYGYKTNWTDNRKYITYTTPDGKKCRDNKLHDKKYLKTEIEGYYERIRQSERTEQAAGDSGSRNITNEAIRNNTIRYSQRAMGSIDRYDFVPTSGSAGNVGKAKRTSNMEEFQGNLCTEFQHANRLGKKGIDKSFSKDGIHDNNQPQLSKEQCGYDVEKWNNRNEAVHNEQLNRIGKQSTGKRYDPSTDLFEILSNRSSDSNNAMDTSVNDILTKTKQIQDTEELDLEDDMDLEMEM